MYYRKLGARIRFTPPPQPQIAWDLIFYTGISGRVVMDSNADREPDYALWHMAPSGEQFDVWTTVKMTAPAGQVLT